MLELSIRLFDIFFALLAIAILFPLFLIVSLILKFSGEGKIFYKQKRIGEKGKAFNLLKFVTMYENSPNMGTGDITIKNDPRILPFGRVLRNTKINELPQLINVLTGHMTLVGFRPHTPNALKNYSAEQKIIVTALKPGLTGYGSLQFSDEENMLPEDPDEAMKVYINEVIPAKVDLELQWQSERNLYHYFRVIFLTALKVLKLK